MGLEDWSGSGLIVPHESSRQEFSELFEIVETDLADARIDAVSSKRRPGMLLQRDPQRGAGRTSSGRIQSPEGIG